MSEYLEGLAAWIDAPLLDSLKVALHNRLIFDTPCAFRRSLLWKTFAFELYYWYLGEENGRPGGISVFPERSTAGCPALGTGIGR